MLHSIRHYASIMRNFSGIIHARRVAREDHVYIYRSNRFVYSSTSVLLMADSSCSSGVD